MNPRLTTKFSHNGYEYTIVHHPLGGEPTITAVELCLTPKEIPVTSHTRS